MKWTIPLIVAAVIAIIFMLKRAGQISARDALIHLKNGALVIDVRSRGEFGSGHLPNAINIPLDEIETALPQRVNDQKQILLLHCLSGMRSGVAKRKLESLGYANVFDLGSLARARGILGNAGRD